MRKVLLATSALVAVGAVSSASADVSVSAYYEFGYSSVSDNITSTVRADPDGTFTDSEVHFKFDTTSDSGLNFGAVFETEGTTAASGTDEASMYISTAEMGKLILGENDEASDSFQTWLPGGRNMATGADARAPVAADNGTMADNGGLKSYANDAQFGDNTRATYMSPSLGGLTLGISWAQNSSTGDNADTSMGLAYTTEMMGASVTFKASNRSDGESGDNSVDATAYGVAASQGAFSLAASTVTQEKKGTNKTTTNGYGVGYTVSDKLSVAANLANSSDDTSKNELTTTSLGASYTIAPGLNFAIAFNSSEYDEDGGSAADMTTEEIRASVQANF